MALPDHESLRRDGTLAGMHYASTRANDGTVLAFQSSLPVVPGMGGEGRAESCIVLMHGFSGSSAYFARNVTALAASGHWVVAPDMRGHGRSGRCEGGYHVARLAADLRDVLQCLRSVAAAEATAPPTTTPRITAVGCSIGAAVLWTYVELFGCAELASVVVVDQAPLQDRSPFGDGGDGGDGGDAGWDASRAHRTCYDEPTLLAAQRAWIERPAEAHRGLVADCFGYRWRPRAGDELDDGVPAEQAQADAELFVAISARCDGRWLARLLADHTRYDHRDALGLMTTLPTLVLAGRRSGCFPLEGMRETVRRIRRAGGRASWLEFDGGHWLFWEEAERFNRVLREWVKDVHARAAPSNG